MEKKKKTPEERIQELDEQIQRTREKEKQFEARKKQLEKQEKERDRKERTRRLIQIGGAVESVLGRGFVEGDVERLMDFLRMQERNGYYFSNAMNKDQKQE